MGLERVDIGSVGVDRRVGAAGAHEIRLFRARHRRKHRRAARLAELDGGRADPAGRAGHQHRIARLHAGAHVDRDPGRVEHGDHGGGVLERHAVGQQEAALLGRGHELAEGAGEDLRHDPVAGFAARHARPDGPDDAGAVAAGHEGPCRSLLVPAPEHQGVREVDPDGPVLDQHLAGAGLGVRQVRDGVAFDGAELVDQECAHGASQPVCRRSRSALAASRLALMIS